MSQAQQDRKIENLIAKYREMRDMCGAEEGFVTEEDVEHLADRLEDYGINVEEIK